MKKILVLIALLNISMFNVFSQFPQAFNYQTIVRDNYGNLLTNQTMSFRISILYGSDKGASVYSELQNITTNQYGLINLSIGTGAVVTGKFSEIDWSLGNYLIKIEIANDAGIFHLMGSASLLSVPYALYSLKSGALSSSGILKNNVSGTPSVTGATGPTGIGYSGINSFSGINTGYGSKIFTTNLSNTNFAYIVGDRARVIYSSNTTIFMEGNITAFSGTSLTIYIDYVSPSTKIGSGYAGWVFSIAGLQGIAGTNGINGTNGITGVTGPQGLQGLQGIPGPTGLSGSGSGGVTGPTGAQGIQGIAGLIGAKGSTGATGATGLNGITGAIGPQGIQGIQGLRGIQGLQGLQGIPGPTGQSGSGSGGLTGPTGPQGIQGITGPAGVAGAKGVTGATGPSGINGLTGPTGPSGNNGTNGINGSQGLIGSTGPMGPIGPAGSGSGGSLPSGVTGQTLRYTGSAWVSSGSIYSDGTNVGIGTTTPSSLLQVKGMLTTNCLKILGGCDLAEPFASKSENILPGMLMVLDPDNPGKLLIAKDSYDKKVIGIVSGANNINPGLIMNQDDTFTDGKYPVALTGRVYCYADASYSPIKIGDMLTTSETPGFAMKVTDYSKSQGAVIGKAMTNLENGCGFVLVFVSIQ